MEKDDLQVLGNIILTDEPINAPTTVDDAISRRGYYAYPSKGTPPVIFLTVPEFYKWVPSGLWWSPAITLRICDTLAHEVGHHVSFMHDNQIENAEASHRELLANDYADSVIELMTRHWYYKLGRFLLKDIADWYFAFGLAAANYGHYQRAAKRFYAAWHLVPEMEQAAEYYWRARWAYEKEVEQCNHTVGDCKS